MVEDKGKGRGKAAPASPGSGVGQALASTLRSSMASSQLGSVLNSAAGGSKDEFRHAAHTSSDQGLREWLTNDLRAQASTSQPVAAPATFRSQQASSSSDAFADFERGTQAFASSERVADETNNQVDWREAGLSPYQSRPPIASYTELDGPLYDAVRRDLEPRLRSTHLSAPAPALTQPQQPADDIFALLDAEDSAPEPVEVSSATRPEVASGVLQNFDARYRAPSPSNSGFSAEQAAMHIALAEAQAAEQGQQELAVPRPDNRDAEEGVYARTAHDALRSIFEGRTESSEVSTSEDSAAAVVNKITRWFAASTYLDDVYGLPPLLRETIEQATSTDESNSELSRQTAIRRLESLWNHISNTPPAPQPQPPAQSKQWVDAWLRSNT